MLIYITNHLIKQIKVKYSEESIELLLLPVRRGQKQKLKFEQRGILTVIQYFISMAQSLGITNTARPTVIMH